MAIQNLPQIYVSEANKFESLFFRETPLSTNVSVSFISTTSGRAYTSSTGELGLKNILYEALKDYIVDEDDFHIMTQQINDTVEKINTLTSTVNSKANTSDLNSKLNLVGGTMIGTLVAQSNISYTIRQVHNIILSTSDANSNVMQNGDIWIKYV